VTPWRNIYLDNHFHFFTAVIQGRVPVFDQPALCRAMLSTWDHHRARMRFALLGYVLMPDHIHLLTHFERGKDCEQFHRVSNRFFARQVILHCRSHAELAPWLSEFADAARRRAEHRVWAEGARNLPISDRSVADQKLECMHMNPVRRGLVSDPCDWPWSSARNCLVDDQAIFRVDVEKFPML
jgi:putative transposase